MKFIIFFALFALTFAENPAQYQLHIPDKCEDVLAVKVCDRLKNTAATLKLKSEEVKNAIVEAYNKGITKADEIEKAVNDFLVNKVLNKKCKDLTSVENCDRLKKLANDMKIQADKVAEFIVKQIAILKTKTCEDLLDADNCNKLRDLAAKLKIKAEKVQEIVIAAYIKYKQQGVDKVVEVYNKVKEYVLSTRCEDVFNPDMCDSFRKYAEKTKVALPVIMETAYDLVKKGISIGTDLINKVYNIVDYFYDCEDVFDQQSCDKLRIWAGRISVTYDKVEVLIKKYVRTFLEKSATIYQTIKDYVQDKIYCRFTSSCQNTEDADELVISKRSIFGDWKTKVLETIKNKLPDLEDSLRQKLEEFVKSCKTFYAFMKQLAMALKDNTDKAFEKYKDLIKNLMIESTL